jgi:O-antigen/teichoic acid export membrane protein
MNVTTYAFTILAARWLGPSEYGAVAALMGLLLVANVAALGLQTTAARRVTTSETDAGDVARPLMTVTYVSALGLGLLMLLLAPLVDAVFDLHSVVAAALVAPTVVLQTIVFGQAGVIQGERRWGPLAWVYAFNGLGRFLFGFVAMMIRPDALGAMIGVTLGAALPLLVGTWAMWSEGSLRPVPLRRTRSAFVETFRNARALLAFLAVSNADIIVARTALSSHESGLYAGGLILAKAVLFLPQFLIIVGFPTMAEGGTERVRNHHRALAVLGIMGAGAVAGAAVLPALALQFVGGAEYDEVRGNLWMFAMVGLVLSLIQFLVYDAVAGQDHATIGAVWVAVVTLAASVFFVDSVIYLLLWALTVETVLAAVLLARSFHPARRVTAD